MKYNTSKYNLKSTNSEDTVISMYCQESINISTTFKTNSFIAVGFFNTMKVKCSGGTAIKNNFDLLEKINSKIILNVYPMVEITGNEKLEIKSTINADYYLSHELTEKLKISGKLVLDIFINQNNTEKLKVFSNLSSNIETSVNVSEVLILNPTVTQLDKLITKINDITLRPGESIVINSDNFTVYDKDNNLLYAYEGNWINISRDTLILEVGCDGDISGNLIVTERYL